MAIVLERSAPARSALLVAGTVLALVAMPIHPLRAAECARPGDLTAMQVRDLQSRLMVAALSCNAKPSYNGFATRFQAVLVKNGHTLKQYFARIYGKSGERELNQFITQLANTHSARSLDDRAGFCAEHDTLFRELSALPASEELESFSARQTLAATGSTPVCDADSYVALLRR